MTFRDLYTVVREAMLALSTNPDVQPFTGPFNSTRPRACGRILPQGCVEHATPHIAPEGVLLLVRLFGAGADRRLVVSDR